MFPSLFRSYWNPAADPYLPFGFSPDPFYRSPSHLSGNLAKKEHIKKTLRDHLRLCEVDRPIIGIIARLVPQKGIEIIKHAMHSVLEKGGQFALLGSSPIESIQQEFIHLKRKFAGNPHISLNLEHQELIARLIYAGSDIFIVPSYFEPCGLTQMISLRYGTIPLVRETGGLKDSIYDVDFGEPSESKGAGYTFTHPTNESFDEAMQRAIHCWYNEPKKWEKIIAKGVGRDFSWKKSVENYLDVYQTARVSKDGVPLVTAG